MKNTYESTLLHWAIFLWFIVGSTACQEDANFRSWDGVLRMDIDAMSTYTVLGTEPPDVVFNINSSTQWSISSDKEWCKPSPTTNTADNTSTQVVVTFEPNEALISRSTTLTIKAEGVLKDKVITITQEAKELFEIRSGTEIVHIEGGTIEFGITSNRPWVIKTSSLFLTNMDKRTGEGNEKGEEEIVRITIPRSESIKRQTGVISVSTDLRERSFTVIQDGSYIEVVEQTPISFSGNEEEKTIAIKANVGWRAEVPEEHKNWLTLEKSNDNELKIRLKENFVFSGRTGAIELIAEEEQFAELNTKVEVQQNTRFILSGSCLLDEEDGSVKVSDKGTVVPTYKIKKGHLTFEFKNINLTGAGSLMIMMNSADGDNGSYRLNINPADVKSSGLWSGGTIGYGAYTKLAFNNHQEVNAIRKLDLYIEESETSSDKINIRVLIDGVEKAILKDKSNIWNDPVTYPKGMTMTMRLDKPLAGDYFVLKSISHEPYE